MTWLLLGVVSGLTASFHDVASKKILHRHGEYMLAWGQAVIAVPFLLIPLLFTGIPPITPRFWTALAVSGGLNTVAAILYMRALKESPLSVVAPMISFTPVLMIGTSWVILRELPGVLGLVGIAMVGAGSYLLNIHTARKDLMEPLRALFRERGAVFMFIVAVIWSVSANFDKIGVASSSPTLWAVSISALLSVTLLPFAVRARKDYPHQGGFAPLLLVGLLFAIILLLICTALPLALAPLVIAAKRSSILFSTSFGGLFFAEQRIPQRLLAAGVMLSGLAALALA